MSNRTSTIYIISSKVTYDRSIQSCIANNSGEKELKYNKHEGRGGVFLAYQSKDNSKVDHKPVPTIITRGKSEKVLSANE